jgi:hypothetical protein
MGSVLPLIVSKGVRWKANLSKQIRDGTDGVVNKIGLNRNLKDRSQSPFKACR